MERASLVLLLAAILAAPAARAANLVVNPDFDVNASGWLGPGEFAAIDADGVPGAGSLRVLNVNPGTGTQAIQRVTLPPATPIRASACVRLASEQSGVGYAEFGLNFFAGACAESGAYVENVSAGFVSTPFDTWVCLEVPEFSPPLGSACVEPTLFVRNNGAAGTFAANFDSIFVPEPCAAAGALAAAAAIAVTRRARGRAAGASRSS